MKKLNWILGVSILGIALFLFLDSLRHVIIYHEQHQLFLFSKEYFHKHIIEAGLRLDYITDFIIQFFYHPFAGAIVVSLLLSMLYLLNLGITCRITQRNDPLHLALIPPLVLIVAHTSIDFKFNCLVGMCITMLFLFFAALIKGWMKYILMISVYLVLVFLFGWKFPTYAVAAAIVSCASAFSVGRIRIGRKLYVVLTSVLICFYGGTTFYWFLKSYNNRERILLEANSSVNAKEWENVLRCAKRYRGDNQLIDYFKNMALYHLGRMPYDLLDYSQTSGATSLYLPWTGEGIRSEYGHYIYEQLGYINEAHRWAFESMVVNGETAPLLLNLIRYNILMERPYVALRFINVLKKSIFYHKKAMQYEEIVFTGRIPDLKILKYDKDEPNRFANVINLGPEFIYILKKQPDNRMAFEYLMSFLLLSNDLPRFMENLRLIDNFIYPEMPHIYMEAMYYYKMSLPRGEFEKLGFDISPETEERFKEYFTLSKTNNIDLLEKKFGNTYWFYINHKSSHSRNSLIH